MPEQVWKHLFAAKFIALAGHGNDLLAEAYVHADQAWGEEGAESNPESLADATYYSLGDAHGE